MNPTIEQLEAAIAAANKKLAELKAAEATQAKKAWPHIGDTYWTIDEGAEVFVSAWASDDTDQARMAVGNVFRTEAEAEHEIDRRKVLTELRRLARESWGGDKADWKNDDQKKFVVVFDHQNNKFGVDDWHSSQFACCVFFASREAARAAVETIGAERLKLLLESFK